MDDTFFTTALQQVRLGVAYAMIDARLDLKPETLTQTVARRLKARMKQLEIILRRLIVLLAFRLTLPPLAPRVAAKPAGAGEAPVDTKSAQLYNIALTGQTFANILHNRAFPADAGYSPGSTSAAPLMRRLLAFVRILDNPERYARRVARTLERQRASGRPRPYCMAMPTHRLHPELGLLAACLPAQIDAAFDRWTGSG